MRVAVLFYMDTVRQSLGKPESTWGRVVANHSFLLQLAAADDIERLAVFVPLRKDVDQLLSSLLKDIPRKIDVVPFLEIPEYLKQTPIDILHCLDPNLWLAGHIRSQLADKPFVITGVTHSLGNEHFLQWALLNNANGIDDGDTLICTTPTAKKVIESSFSRLKENQPDFRIPQTHVIPLGVSLEDLEQSSSLPRDDLQLDADDFVILSLSRFDAQFKMDLIPLLNLMQLVKAQSDLPIKLILAGSSGDGRYAKAVEQLVLANGLESSVSLLVNLTDEKKVGAFQMADAFLSLSDNLQETFGLSVVEALASGLPVIASDWNGYKSLVRDGENGYLVPSMMLSAEATWEASLALQLDNATHLFSAQTTAIDLPHACRAILKLASDPEKSKRMGDAARQSSAQYDWTVIIQQYLKLWHNLKNNSQNALASYARSSAIGHLTDFSAYPTSQISPDSCFQTSEIGQLLRQGKKTVNFYPNTEEFLELPLMAKLLNFFHQQNDVSKMIEELENEPNVPALKLLQNLLWLYKYGYVELKPAENNLT